MLVNTYNLSRREAEAGGAERLGRLDKSKEVDTVPLVSNSVLESLRWQRGQDSRWNKLDKTTTQEGSRRRLSLEKARLCMIGQ